MVCWKCGAEYSDSLKKCPYCKSKKSKADEIKKVRSAKGLRIAFIVITALAAFIVFLYGFWTTFRPYMISDYPKKMEYYVGDSLDLSGTSIRTTNMFGYYIDRTSDISFSPKSFTEAGDIDVIISYKDKDFHITVSVLPVEIENVELNKKPSKLHYYVGDSLDTTNLELKVTKNNGDVETITDDFKCSIDVFEYSGKQNVTVEYEGFSETFSVDVEEVLVSSIEIANKPSKTSYFQNENVSTDGLLLKVNYNNGETETITEGYSYYPEVLKQSGSQTVSISYGEKTASYDVSVSNITVSSLKIITNPKKTSYYSGDTFDSTGLSLLVTYNNGKTETISSGFTCSPTKLSNTGTQVITVNYGGVKTSFYVNVTAVTMTSLTVISQPSKTSYYSGDAFNSAGLVLKATYNNGKTETVNNNFSISPSILTGSGVQYVKATYNGKSVDIKVTVTALEISSLSVYSNPNTTTFYVGDANDTTGLKLRAYYNNGTSSIITSGFNSYPSSFTSAGTKTVAITYGNKTVTYYVTVIANDVVSVSVAANPSKTSYYTGDEFQTAGLSLNVKYANGETKRITSGFTCSPTKFSSSGSQYVTVTYGGKSTSIYVSVSSVSITSVNLYSYPSKTSYYSGDTLDTSGLSLQIYYSNGKSEIITSGFTCSPTTLTNSGYITVSYGSRTVSFYVNVTKVSITSLSIASTPKTSYYVGDTLDTTGLTLKVIYNNGKTEYVTSGFTCSPTTLSYSGTRTITVSYSGYSTTYTVNVQNVKITSVEIQSLPDKLTYNPGNYLVTSGLKLKITYNSGNTITVDKNYSCSPTYFSTVGTKTVTVSYGGVSTTFNVNVVALQVSSISIRTMPTKTSYYVRDTLETSGLTLLATYNDGSTSIISSGYTCSETTLNKVGAQEITVYYEGQTTAFNITVKSVTVTSVSLKTLPSKTSYYVGDSLQTSGLSLSVTYDNGKSAVITSGYSCSPETFDTTGTQTVYVKYAGKTVSFTVNVTYNISSLAIGSTIKLGEYEQDNITYNGKEEIEWIVLAKSGSKVLVVSKYILDTQPYNSSGSGTTWEQSSLRQWCNGDFYDSAFTSAEKKMIVLSTVKADSNPVYTVNAGLASNDRVFILSYSEIEQYLSNSQRAAETTEYVKQKGILGYNATYGWWWLRTPGSSSSNALYASVNGTIEIGGYAVLIGMVGVRPAMWINIG